MAQYEMKDGKRVLVSRTQPRRPAPAAKAKPKASAPKHAAKATQSKED